jgi:phosphopantothenoylcysteine decarboxylase/phosphopantothenate--cysteine ligase
VSGKRVLLIVGGGIAAYKALELVRLLRRADVGVQPILTRAGEQFVTPLSLSALAEAETRRELFSLTDEAAMGHIELSRSADLVVVAPATADLMAKAAHGLADDLASTTLLATDKPVLMAPAMNVRMWDHAATRRNLAALQGDGVRFVGPDEGAMACGEYGFGRMAEPAAIHDAILALLGELPPPPARGPVIVVAGAAASPTGRPLAGKHVLVTAGPTAEPIDPVRLLTNRSSGKQGYAIAEALAALGARVTLVSGPVALPAPAGVRRVMVETASDMLQACQAALPAEAAVCVAAVADWRPETSQAHKIKKGPGGQAASLKLVENPDILAALARPGPARPALVVGFAAETDQVEAHAKAKLKRKGCDWIVANDVSAAGVMGGDANEVMLVTAQGVEHWDAAAKTAIGARLANRIAEALV